MLVRLGLELVVVFVGVYAAFAISAYEARRSADERRHQLQLALVREIRDITANTERVAESMPPMLARFDSLVSAGARPALEPLIEPVRVQTHMWEATLQSGGLDLFDVPTVYQLSQFYNQLNAGFEQLTQLRALSETLLIPNLGRGPDEFYDPETGRLRPKYQWHRSGRQRLGRLAASITMMGDSLAAELEARTARHAPRDPAPDATDTTDAIVPAH
jgi:hypothetical protein